ncbi:MAG TPA: response regulator transcription factor [Anaerolineales bacterium]|jgi:DNA-binding response OmpR family regulator
MKLLVVEDDPKLGRLIQSVLAESGFPAELAADGDTGLDLALRGHYDVAVIDWMLPGRDGPAICRAVRAAGIPTALILLTARSQIEDRVAGLDSGADDYLVKPFAFEELLARVRALGRRGAPLNRDTWELRTGQVVMDLGAHTARRGETPLDLTKTEWSLLEFFLRHPGQILTRQQILDYVWSYDTSVQPSLVDVYVSYLRKKLDQPGLGDPILTVRGVGYRWQAPDVP